MPDVRITIGGRDFEVACQEGEEHFLRAAASMLDTEAQVLVAQIGRLPEARMLLMSALMLADKTAALEDQLRAAEERIKALEEGGAVRDAGAEEETARSFDPGRLAGFANRAEDLAERLEAALG